MNFVCDRKRMDEIFCFFECIVTGGSVVLRPFLAQVVQYYSTETGHEQIAVGAFEWLHRVAAYCGCARDSVVFSNSGFANRTGVMCHPK